MKRLVLILAVIVLPVAGYFLLISSLLSVDAAQERVTAELSAWTGRDISFGDGSELRLFPAPRLVLRDLRVGGPDGNSDAEILTAKKMQADIRILPLIIGQTSFSALTLTKADLRLLRDPAGKRNWLFDGGPAAVQLALSGDLPIGRFVLKNATVTYDNTQRNKRETVLVPDLTLEWEGIRQPTKVRGTVTMRNESINFQTRISNPLAFIDRKSTAFKASLASDMLDAELTGQLADYKAVRFAGQLEANGPSLRRILTFFGGTASAGPGLGPFALTGEADIKPNDLFIDQGQIQLDGNIATGSLGVTFEDTPKLSGTLAFQGLNLTPYLLAVSGANPVDWQQRTIETDWFENLDTDLRLSANQLQAGPYIFGGMAASVILTDRNLEVGVAQSTFYDGIATGAISATDLGRDDGQKVGIQLRVTEFNLGQAIKSAGSPSDLGGTATMSIDLQTEGQTLGQQFDNLTGSISLLALNGGVPDLGLGAAADALAANAPLNGISRGGASFYQRLKVGGTISNGNLSFTDLLITAGTYAASLQGSYRGTNGEVSLSGMMTSKQPVERQGRVEIRGSVAGPMIILTPVAE